MANTCKPNFNELLRSLKQCWDVKLYASETEPVLSSIKIRTDKLHINKGPYVY